MAGSIRVVSKRKAPGSLFPDAGETVIDVDRTNRVLGNRHVLDNHNDIKRRMQVISAYAYDLARDRDSGGPMEQEIARIAERVRFGERIALRCWCAPLPCHGDLIRQRIEELAGVEPEQVDMFG